jgi:hypothetical protein
VAVEDLPIKPAQTLEVVDTDLLVEVAVEAVLSANKLLLMLAIQGLAVTAVMDVYGSQQHSKVRLRCQDMQL